MKIKILLYLLKKILINKLNWNEVVYKDKESHCSIDSITKCKIEMILQNHIKEIWELEMPRVLILQLGVEN